MKRSSATWAGPREGQGDAGTMERRERGVERPIQWPVDGVRNSRPQDAAPRSRGAGRLGPLERDLHDTVLQDLLCVSLGLNALKRLRMEEGARDEVDQLQQVASQAYDHLRDLLSGSAGRSESPRKMSDILVATVRSFNLKSGADAQVQLNDSSRSLAVSGEAARQAELIVHEALCNAWRHGKAHSLKVVLSETADIVWVKVMDDGNGFDPSLRRDGHYGLRIMQERAETIGARLGISSSPGKGTCVNLYLPSHHPTSITAQEVSNGHSFAGRR